MSDESAFLSAITKTPDDDTVRLVYADWLQERNDPRAEYLRLEVRRHRMTWRQKRTADPSDALERLRTHATPDWLSRIDRAARFSMYWPQDPRRNAERDYREGEPLAIVYERGNHNTRFPKAMGAGDYLYVFAFRGQLSVVGRMRIVRPVETPVVLPGGVTYYNRGFEGTEGTPVRFDLALTDETLRRLSWFAGRKERGLNLSSFSAEGRLTSPTSVSGVLRLTPRTAADLDAVLRGDPLLTP